MGAWKALAGNESRARRLAIDNITLELILVYGKELCREQPVSETRSTGARDEVRQPWMRNPRCHVECKKVVLQLEQVQSKAPLISAPAVNRTLRLLAATARAGNGAGVALGRHVSRKFNMEMWSAQKGP